MRALVLLVAAALPWTALAQTQATPLPQKHIPVTVLMELRQVESQFDLALSRDCAPERCVSKGCVYRDHAVVDLPRNGSLPGLGQPEGPGSVPPQEYLTQAHCDFAHEKSVASRDVDALVRRLEQRLSKGWLQVSVGRQILEPISPALSESPLPPPEKPKPVVEPKVVAPPPPEKWEADVALRELWVSLLPHFSWMIALVLVTMATLMIIWGLRRLGRESLEEKALLAQLQNKPPETPATEPVVPGSNGVDPAHTVEGLAQAAFVADQQKLWADRISQAELAKDEGAVVGVLREWLKAGEFDLLAKAIAVFGDRLSLAFSSDGELAARKVAFADYMKNLDEKKLPSDADFFRTLNQHAISASLLSQSDTDVYRSLRDEFGSTGLVHLIDNLPPRPGALLFALVPTDCQQELARSLPAELRLQVASQLLSSNRISKEDQAYVFEALNAARAGQPLPIQPESAPGEIIDRGREFDAAGALSVLMPAIDAQNRVNLFEEARERSSNGFPLWYENILYPDMLQKLSKELQADTLLEVDVKGLAGWFSVQPSAFQESFLSQLAPSMQNAVRANMTFGSRSDQFRMARLGHNELVSSLKRQLARGTLSFSQMVA